MAADIYDALISDRVYRRAMDHDRALDIVAENPEIKRWVFLALEKFHYVRLRYCSQHDIIKLYFYQTLEYRKILNIFKNQVNRKLSIMGIN